MKNSSLQKPGSTFDFKGINWTVLDPDCEGGVLAITSKLWLEDVAFDEGGRNDYCKSSIREKLHELESKIDMKNLVLRWTDLTADNGSKEYGVVNDGVFLLSCDDYRKYRDVIPHYDGWIWTCTPWATSPSSHASTVRVVNTDGTLSNYHAVNSYGAAPACIFNPKSLTTQGGSETYGHNLFTISQMLNEKEILSQLAEEASELAQAALKFRRSLDNENPTPVSYDEALQNLAEEMGDVILLNGILLLADSKWRKIYDDAPAQMEKKAERWSERLKERDKDNG